MRKHFTNRHVTLLTMEGPASRTLAHVLLDNGLLNSLVVESRQSWGVRRIRRAVTRRLSAIRGGRVDEPELSPAQRVERNLLLAAQVRIAEDHHGRVPRWPRGIPRRQVDHLNLDPTCRKFLAKMCPDLIVVFHTRIIRRDVFGMAKLGAVNCHFSLLPRYRGNFVEFFITLNRDLDAAGVTFHFLDDGVDTGDIIEQVSYSDLPQDISPFDLQYRNYGAMLEHFPRVLNDILEGKHKVYPQPASESRAYRRRDITPELRRLHYGRLGLL